jgi:integrase
VRALIVDWWWSVGNDACHVLIVFCITITPKAPWSYTSGFGKGHRAALPRIRLHDVRHSYATAPLAAGVPPKVISQRLGHAPIAITMDTYGHVIAGWTNRPPRRSPA